jgi:hypothetical protein
LPFIGSKLRWWRELQILAAKLPQGGCVFDAFGGSFSAARVIKDTRPDLTVITNDYCHAYRQRLNAAPQTAEVYEQLVSAVGRRNQNYMVWDKFKTQDEKNLAISIVETAEDSETAWRWLHGKAYPLNKTPINCPVCPKTCDEWTKGLVVIDDEMTAYEARYWAESEAFVILDPPYMGSVKMGFDLASTYEDGRIDAQAFCCEIMRLCDRWCLFERPDSALVCQARAHGAIEVERMHGRNRQTVDEIMLVCSQLQKNTSSLFTTDFFFRHISHR